jgi:hypothetical protein
MLPGAGPEGLKMMPDCRIELNQGRVKGKIDQIAILQLLNCIALLVMAATALPACHDEDQATEFP